MTDFKKLKVVELRAELASRNLPQTGKRDELIERLEEYEFQHAEPSTDICMDMPQAVDIDPVVSHEIAVSPITPPAIDIPASSVNDIEAIEEEKRRLRALRFSLDKTETAQVKIEVTIKRLDHALPNRSHSHHNRHRGIKKHSQHRQISINKP